MTDVSQQEAIALGRMLYQEFMGTVDRQNALEMIEDGAMLNMANPEGITTLMCACAGGHTEIVKAMLHSGRDVGLEAQDSHGWTALITAAHRGNAEMLTALLTAGANPKAKDKMDRDALYYAKGDAEKMKVLQRALADESFTQRATVLQQPVSVRKPLQYKP
jgi:ankyrin repeat protein